MGWWRIKDVETGQIDFDAAAAGVTANAVPGVDDAEHLHGGDGPADVMGAALKEINARYREAWGRDAKSGELQACFNFVFNGLRRSRGEIGEGDRQ